MGLFDKLKNRNIQSETSETGVSGNAIQGVKAGNTGNKKAAFEKKIWEAYPGKLDGIAEYLAQDESMRAFFGDLTKEEVAAKLNEPSIKVFDGGGVLSYCDHEFDDIHIIDLEFDGVLEEFTNVSIDG